MSKTSRLCSMSLRWSNIIITHSVVGDLKELPKKDTMAEFSKWVLADSIKSPPWAIAVQVPVEHKN